MIVRIIFSGLVLISCMSAGVRSNYAVKPAVFALNPDVLSENKSRIQNKDASIMPAYKSLIKDADQAMKFGPVSVMEKKHMPPSGDKHDYMSLAPYHWPDSSKKDGLPYIRKDGQTNPEVKEYKDKDYMPKLCEAVYTLGLAWYYSNDRSYAEHAAKLVRVWFLDTATRMNPNLNYAQAIKGENEGRGAGIIDARHFIKVVDAIGLIKNSKYWSNQDQAGMQKWFSQYLHWLRTSPNGVHEMNTKNNHGVWYDAQCLSLALFVDSTELAKKIVLTSKDRLDKQLNDNGRFPKEMERTISLHYSVFVIDAFFMIASMAEKIGIDLWNYTSPSGKSLKKAFDTHYPYISNEKEWDGQQIKPYPFEEGYQILADAALKYNCLKCPAVIRDIADDKADRLRLRLLTKINF